MSNLSIVGNYAGPHAAKIGGLFWLMFTVEALVFAIVVGVLIYALWSRVQREPTAPFEPSNESERRTTMVVGTAIGLTILILTIFIGTSYAVDKSLLKLDSNPEIDIEITAHQWWWEARYLNDKPSSIFTTANEIHVPVGAKIRFLLSSNDVIHSLWFPNLSGKQDIIPGRSQTLVVQADREGVWHGRCAEFCGLEHAKMDILLVAEPRAQYEAWRTAQILPAAEPKTAEEIRGREIFTTGACVVCHTIRGTDAEGYSANAPDLTHLKSRMMIGAGSVPNSKGYLGGWILDPHGIKPGVHMPTILQEPEDFQALLAYLEILK